jgi:hypothetical protein
MTRSFSPTFFDASDELRCMAERLGAADQATEFPQKGYGETEGSPSGEGFPPLAAEPIGKRIDAFNAVSKLVMGGPPRCHA